MSDLKIKKAGWVVITPTLCQGDTISWSTEDDKQKAIPLVFDTHDDAWKEIAGNMIDSLSQFIDGDRDFQDTDFSTYEYVALYTEYEDGSFVITIPGDEGVTSFTIMQSTLEEWRKTL